MPSGHLAERRPLNGAGRLGDFIIASPLDPGFADVQITINPVPGVPAVQDKFIPAVDLARYGMFQAAPGSFGYPNSFVEVAAPEPTSIAILGAGLVGLLGLCIRRMHGISDWPDH
jgi:hypothetical protein